MKLTKQEVSTREKNIMNRLVKMIEKKSSFYLIQMSKDLRERKRVRNR